MWKSILDDNIIPIKVRKVSIKFTNICTQVPFIKKSENSERLSQIIDFRLWSFTYLVSDWSVTPLNSVHLFRFTRVLSEGLELLWNYTSEMLNEESRFWTLSRQKTFGVNVINTPEPPVHYFDTADLRWQ